MFIQWHFMRQFFYIQIKQPFFMTTAAFQVHVRFNIRFKSYRSLDSKAES